MLTPDIIDDFNTAAWQDEVRQINALAKNWPDLVDPRQPHLLHALHTACNSCQPHAAKVLVEKYGADVNAVIPGRGMTALHEALNSHDNVTARMLIKNGADVNAQTGGTDDTAGWTALHYAVSSRDAGMAAFLLRRNADPHIKNAEGLTPMDFARRKGKDRSNLVMLLARKAKHPWPKR
jgi:ankyrin repeat protein